MAGSATVPAGTQQGAAAGAPLAAGLLVLLPLAVVALGVAVLTSVLATVQNEPVRLSDGFAGDPYAVEHFGAMYRDAAAVFDVSPYLLMAVHEDETNYGRSTLPGVRDGFNLAGCCAGPMQFLITGGPSPAVGGTGGTWHGPARSGARLADGYLKAKLKRPDDYPNRFEPHPNVYDSFDSIYAAASYFHDLGAGPKLDERTYEALIRYKGRPPASIPFARHDYERAKALEASGALLDGLAIEDTKPRTPERVMAVANWIDQQNQPYCWAGGHAPNPGPSRGTRPCVGERAASGVGLDCSGAIRWLLVLSGYPDPGGISSDYYGAYLEPKAGKRITFYYGPPNSGVGHIYATIDGRVWEASPAAPGALAGWSGPRMAGDDYVAGHVSGL